MRAKTKKERKNDCASRTFFHTFFVITGQYRSFKLGQTHQFISCATSEDAKTLSCALL